MAQAPHWKSLKSMISIDASGKPIVVRSTGTPARCSIAGCTAATTRSRSASSTAGGSPAGASAAAGSSFFPPHPPAPAPRRRPPPGRRRAAPRAAKAAAPAAASSHCGASCESPSRGPAGRRRAPLRALWRQTAPRRRSGLSITLSSTLSNHACGVPLFRTKLTQIQITADPILWPYRVRGVQTTRYGRRPRPQRRLRVCHAGRAGGDGAQLATSGLDAFFEMPFEVWIDGRRCRRRNADCPRCSARRACPGCPAIDQPRGWLVPLTRPAPLRALRELRRARPQ